MVDVNANDVLALLPPYPIVLVSTRTNAITINQMMYFTFKPLRIGIAVAHVRYSYDLLKQEREFVINVPTATHIDAIKFCGAHSGREGNKFIAAGLQTEAAETISALRLSGWPAHIECQVDLEIDFEQRTWFVGCVTAAACESGHQGMQALQCGRSAYTLPGEVIAPRP